MNYMGIDHHRQYSHITLLDEEGKVVKSGRVANFRRELEEFLFLPPWQLEPFRLDYPIQLSCINVNHDSEDLKDDWKVGRDGAEAIRGAKSAENHADLSS